MYSEKKGPWIGYWLDGSARLVSDVEGLLAITRHPGRVLRDDHRSLVKLVTVKGLDVVAKQPRDKNRRTWIRVLTSVRKSEVTHVLSTLGVLQARGVPTTSPIAAMERRRFGMVVDSWLFYFYREGRSCTEAELPQVIQVLHALHRAGVRHEDSHIDNFLFDGEQVFIIDCKGKPRLGAVSDYYDFLVLDRRSSRGLNIADHLDIDTHSLAYRLADVYAHYRSARQALKKAVRRALGRPGRRSPG